MLKNRTLLLSLLLPALLLADGAFADDRGHEGFHGEHGGGDWHGDIHRFHEHDFDRWRGGSWLFGFHEGHNGWWWIVGDGWYYYPQPIYPYPDPYMPPDVVLETAPIPTPTAVARPVFWYYCQDPAGYYPYVSRCYTPWQRVHAIQQVVQAPPPVIVQAPPPAPAPTMIMTDDAQRTRDDRQLNSFAVQFANIDLQSGHGKTILRDLEKQVSMFHQDLFLRHYNAMDILKDTENLQKRMSDQGHMMPKHSNSGQTPGTLTPPVPDADDETDNAQKTVP